MGELALVVGLVWAACSFAQYRIMRSDDDKLSERYPMLGTPEEQRINFPWKSSDWVVFILTSIMGPLGLVTFMIGRWVINDRWKWR